LIVVDANILLYAYDRSSPRHDTARMWLEAAVGGSEELRFGLVTLLAFLRISTNPAVFHRPLRPSQAIAIVTSWLSRQSVGIATPSDRHWRILDDLANKGQARGPMLMDAHIAALAIEHGASLATTDRDFARFPGLRLLDPTAG
jgi:uncharacterized protein